MTTDAPAWRAPWQDAPPAQPTSVQLPPGVPVDWNVDIVATPLATKRGPLPANLDRMEALLAAQRGRPFTAPFRDPDVREAYVEAFARALPAMWEAKLELRSGRSAAPVVKDVDIYGLGTERYAALPQSALDVLLESLAGERLFRDDRRGAPGVPLVANVGNIAAYKITLLNVLDGQAASPGIPAGAERVQKLRDLDPPYQALAYELLRRAADVWREAELQVDDIIVNPQAPADAIPPTEYVENVDELREPFNELASAAGAGVDWVDNTEASAVRANLISAAMELVGLAQWRRMAKGPQVASEDQAFLGQPDAAVQPLVAKTDVLEGRLRTARRPGGEVPLRGYAANRVRDLLAVLEEMDLAYEAPAGVAEEFVAYIQSVLTNPARLFARAQIIQINGPPGVGKTDFASYLSRCLVALRVYGRTKLARFNRNDLVGPFEGQTTVKTRTFLLRNAFNGVAFVDEAYQLVQGERDSVGREALEAVFNYINDYPETMLILAGYPRELNALFAAQPGLGRRIEMTFMITGYTALQLKRIAVAYFVQEGRRQQAGVPYLPRVRAEAMAALNAWIDFAVAPDTLAAADRAVRAIDGATPREEAQLRRDARPLGNYVGDLVRVLARAVELTRNELVTLKRDSTLVEVRPPAILRAIDALTAEKRRQFQATRQAVLEKE